MSLLMHMPTAAGDKQDTVNEAEITKSVGLLCSKCLFETQTPSEMYSLKLPLHNIACEYEHDKNTVMLFLWMSCPLYLSIHT